MIEKLSEKENIKKQLNEMNKKFKDFDAKINNNKADQELIVQNLWKEINTSWDDST